LNGCADTIQPGLTLRILRESSKWVCGHGICQNPAGRGLFLAARLEFFGAANKKGIFSQEGAAPFV
jgi:hypothetical protein